MKKTIYITITTLVFFSLENLAIADEIEISTTESQTSLFSSVFNKSHFEKDFSASVGVKAWVNHWNLPVGSFKGNPFNTNNFIEQINMSFDSETETVFLPTLSLRYKNFFVSGSYFPNTDYNFQKQNKILAAISDPPTTSSLIGVNAELLTTLWNISSERKEFDINLGYYLTPSLVVTAGYKKIDRNFNLNYRVVNYYTGIASDLNELQKVHDVKQSTDGFTLGVAGVAPLKGKFGIYGSFAFGWLNTDKELPIDTILGNSSSYDADYYLGELGLVYSSQFDKIPMLNAASFYAGYRFQALKEEANPNSTDMTEGFVLGVNLNF